jgi:hypothetical protein
MKSAPAKEGWTLFCRRDRRSAFVALAVDADPTPIAVAAAADDGRAAVVTIAPTHANCAVRADAAGPINTSCADDGVRFNRQSRHQTKR